MASLKTLYCSQCGGIHLQVKAWVDANTNEYISDTDDDDVWCDDCEENVNPATLSQLWSKLSKVPVNENDEIEEDFLCFEKGTSKFDVWHWFDDRCPNNLHDDLMFNNNEDE